MRQVLLKKGQVIVGEVPAPIIRDKSILVQVAYSCISTGTEISGVTSSGESLLQRALKEPEKIKKALDLARSRSIPNTIAEAKAKLDSLYPLGYSCAGKVVDVGKNIEAIIVGDKVACAGAGYANHAEIVCVPQNLVVKAPHNLDLRDAASVTLGAIAMQGIRRAEVRLGENIAVIGL
ncbi:oxidoreductase, partial [bacterium]|nr:oxidoreductase [bacterium]